MGRAKKKNGVSDRAGEGEVGPSLSPRTKEMVMGIKEIVDCSEQEILSMLRESLMDADEAVQRLISLDTFHEVKSKRERRKEVKETKKSRSQVQFSSKYGLGRSSMQYDEQSLSAGICFSEQSKAAIKEEIQSTAPAFHSSAVPVTSGPEIQKLTLCREDIGDRGQLPRTSEVISTSVLLSPRFQRDSLPTDIGRLTMADIVRMDRNFSPQFSGPARPDLNADLTLQSQNNAGSHAFLDGHPKIEQPASCRIPDSDLVPASSASNGNMNIKNATEYSDDEELFKGPCSGFNKHMFKHQEAGSSAAANLQDLSVENPPTMPPSIDKPGPFPDYIEKSVDERAEMSFGTYSGSNSALTGPPVSKPQKNDLLKASVAVDSSSAEHLNYGNHESTDHVRGAISGLATGHLQRRNQGNHNNKLLASSLDYHGVTFSSQALLKQDFPKSTGQEYMVARPNASQQSSYWTRQISAHPYLQPSRPSEQTANMIGYSSPLQSSSSITTSTQQPYDHTGVFHQTNRLIGTNKNLLEDRIAGTAGRLPLSAIYAHYPASVPTVKTNDYDVVGSQYLHGNWFSHGQNDRSSSMEYGLAQRTLSPVQGSSHFGLPEQNQLHPGNQQCQLSSQYYGTVGNPNVYPSQIRSTQDHRSLRSSDLFQGGFQNPSVHPSDQIWPRR